MGDRTATAGDRIALGLTIAAVLFLAGAVVAGSTLPERPARQEFTLDVTSQATEEGVVVQGRTNLPRGARLDVVVDRLYLLEGKDTWSAARVGEGSVVVDGETWEVVVPVDEAGWVKDLADEIAARRADPVEVVQESLRTTVVFSPLTAQPHSVVDVMGANFERLADSDMALKAGEFWMLRQRHEVRRPLRLDLEGMLFPGRA